MLKKHDYMGDPELGKMWDRSLIYVATEFGRGKTRRKDAETSGTSHHLNNGSVLILVEPSARRSSKRSTYGMRIMCVRLLPV